MALIRHHCARRVAFTPGYLVDTSGCTRDEVDAAIEQAIEWKWCYPSISKEMTKAEKNDPFRKAKDGQMFYIGRLS